jgi:hypothetical protein
VVNSGASLTLQDLVLDGGYASGSDGGAIVNHGTLIIENSIIQGSETDIAHSGGAIFSDGPVTLSNSRLRFNSAGSAGALFANFGSARVQITNSVFEHNAALNTSFGFGGALWVGQQAHLSLSDGAFFSNTARLGGALYVSAGAAVTLTSSALADSPAGRPAPGAEGAPANALELSHNAASLNGGAIHNAGALTLAGVVLQANRVPTDSVVGGFGGAIHSEVPLSLRATRFVDNQAKFGGGLLILAPPAAFTTTTTTIEQADFVGNWAEDRGGGLYAAGASPVALADTEFIGNISREHGGGAYFGAAVTLQGGLFQNNRCREEFCLGAGLAADSTVTLTSTQFVSNSSAGHGGGLGLVNDHAVVLSDSQFISNAAEFAGGGAYLFGPASVSGGLFQDNRANNGAGGLFAGRTLALTGTQFMGNSSGSSGGGAFVAGAATLAGGRFENNQCTRGDCGGGGLFVGNALTLTASLFIGNTSAGDGGGLYQARGDGQIVNALFARNAAGGHGAALYLGAPVTTTVLHTTIAGPAPAGLTAVHLAGGTAGITNSIIAGHAVGLNLGSGSLFEDYNLFFEVPTATFGSVTRGGHSVTDEPAFADAAQDDYRLAASSAALDAGVDAGVDADFEGDPRPLGGGFDLGFDEAGVWRLYLPMVRR